LSLQYGIPFPVREIKAAGDGSFEVSGYASTFGNLDLGGDVIMRGAFDETLASERKVKFLYAHDPTQVLGVPLSLKVDDVGLFGRFKISRTRLGEEVHTLLKDGALDSFSIGFFPGEVDFDPDTGARLIKSLELLEVSQVAIPMNPDAVVTSVKDLLAMAYLPDGQRRDSQPLRFEEHGELVLSMLQAYLLRSKGYADLRASQDRSPSTAFVERLTSVRTAVDELLSIKAAVAAPDRPVVANDDQPPVEPTEAPVPDPSAPPSYASLLALKRARLRNAGILEMPSHEHDRSGSPVGDQAAV
jgi:uncharacterized protein